MPPKSAKISIEDLAEVITDTQIVNALAKALTPLMTLTIV